MRLAGNCNVLGWIQPKVSAPCVWEFPPIPSMLILCSTCVQNAPTWRGLEPNCLLQSLRSTLTRQSVFRRLGCAYRHMCNIAFSWGTTCLVCLHGCSRAPQKDRRCVICFWPPRPYYTKCCSFAIISQMFCILFYDLGRRYLAVLGEYEQIPFLGI